MSRVRTGGVHRWSRPGGGPVSPTAMTPERVRSAVDGGAVVLDLQTPRRFAERHVPDAVNLQFNRADLVDRAEMVLPADEIELVVSGEPEAIARMAAKLLEEGGFRVLGFLAGGLDAWEEAGFETATMETVEVDDLAGEVERWTVVDAREFFEFKYGHVPGSVRLGWTEAWRGAAALEAEKPIAVICGDEIRSALVASILEREGKPATLVVGGMVDWLDRGYPVEKTTSG